MTTDTEPRLEPMRFLGIVLGTLRAADDLFGPLPAEAMRYPTEVLVQLRASELTETLARRTARWILEGRGEPRWRVVQVARYFDVMLDRMIDLDPPEPAVELVFPHERSDAHVAEPPPA